MSALRNVRMLTRYAAWANSLLYVTLGEQPELELTKPRQIVFGNLIRTLNHVHTIDLVWQAHLEGKVHGFTTRTPDVVMSFSDLRIGQAARRGNARPLRRGGRRLYLHRRRRRFDDARRYPPACGQSHYLSSRPH